MGINLGSQIDAIIRSLDSALGGMTSRRTTGGGSQGQANIGNDINSVLRSLDYATGKMNLGGLGGGEYTYTDPATGRTYGGGGTAQANQGMLSALLAEQKAVQKAAEKARADAQRKAQALAKAQAAAKAKARIAVVVEPDLSDRETRLRAPRPDGGE